jgi:hypothetical protein
MVSFPLLEGLLHATEAKIHAYIFRLPNAATDGVHQRCSHTSLLILKLNFLCCVIDNLSIIRPYL